MFLLEGVEVNEAILRNLSELSKSEQTFEQGVTYQKETLAPEVEIPIGIESILDEIFISEDRNLVEFLIESKLYTPLVRVLLNESNTTKEKFLNWFKLQEDYDETVVLPILEELRAVEMGNRIALSDVLALISTDQKRVLVCLMIKTQQWKSCNTLLQLESAEAQWAYVQWKTQPPTLYTDEDEEYFAPPHPEDEDFNTEANVTDTDISPDEWSPSFGHSFFQHFPPEMNILVLGESGVGKSSFINGIANYLKFPNIHVAKENCEVLIEAHFTLLDQELKSRRIICKPTIKQTEEESSNERTDVAHSCTKEPKAYQFSVGQGTGQKTIRIIDTPGIGDTAGIEQDHENFRKILTYLSNYQEIHAILILLKPNEQRLRVPLRFCLNELFTHFHISARQNVIFCFTHARETFYDAGETKFLLEAHLHNIGNEIPLTEKTMYYFDSETFRFVCAWKDGVTFNADQEKIFNTSWQHSVNETFRLFEQVAKLPPHKTEETLGVNSLRQIVFAMARPMTEMARASAENARLIQKRVDEVNFLLRAGKDIGDKLFVEQISLEKETFDKPRTVCANCVELVPMIKGDSNSCFETIHKFICHDPCELNGVQTELFPNEALKNCWAFQENESCCKICKCPWNSHLHITYRLKKKVTRILDTSVLNSNMSKIDQARYFKERAMKEKQRLEQQRDMIQRYCAEFGAYLRANSLIEYNDSYTEYVDYLITETIQLLEGQGRITDRVRTTEEIKIMVQDLKRSTGTILQDIQTLEWINVKKQNEDNAHRIPLKDSWMDRRYTCSEPEHYQKKGKKHNNFFGSAKDTARHLFGF